MEPKSKQFGRFSVRVIAPGNPSNDGIIEDRWIVEFYDLDGKFLKKYYVETILELHCFGRKFSTYHLYPIGPITNPQLMKEIGQFIADIVGELYG